MTARTAIATLAACVIAAGVCALLAVAVGI